MTDWICPVCGQEIELDIAHWDFGRVGSKLPCPACGVLLRVEWDSNGDEDYVVLLPPPEPPA